MEFPEVIKKKSCGISTGLGFRSQIFCGGLKEFCGVSKCEALFCLEFSGVKQKPKNSRGFSKKYVLNHLRPSFLFFFWNSPLRYWLNRGVHPCMGCSFPHSQYICCKYIINDGENPQSYSILLTVFK